MLTEPTRFDGSMEHLERSAQALRTHGVPAMRKDFLFDPYQVVEARVAGAGGVLVILRMIDRSRIIELLDCAAMLKLFVLLEGFDEVDLALGGGDRRGAQGNTLNSCCSASTPAISTHCRSCPIA